MSLEQPQLDHPRGADRLLDVALDKDASDASLARLRPDVQFGAVRSFDQDAVLCSHCGLGVPAARVRAEANVQFCCAGCETVFGLLKHAGLDDYYDYRERLGEAGRRVELAETTAQDFDSESFRQLYCQEMEGGHRSATLQLEGVHCAACVWLVERVGRIESAVVDARVDIEKARLEIIWDPQRAPLSRIAASLQALGYTPRPFRAREAEAVRRRELRSLLVRMGVAGASAGNVMLMAFALYSGAVGIDEAGTMDSTTRRFFEVASLVVSLPALWAGSLFFRGAWASLRTRVPHMDLPIALGIFGGFLWGGYGALTGRGELYFDSITTLVFFLLVGRYIQRRHQMAYSEASELVHAVLPADATVRGSDGELRKIPRDELEPGALVVVNSGEVLAVDGTVVEGRSALDKSLLSGESRPVDVQSGDAVEAGALNLGQRLVIAASSSGASTRVARLMQEVERALSTKTPLTSQADRLAGGFTVTVIVIAVLVGGYWWHLSPALAVEHALALLIVACPCALGLATPLALSASVKKAAAAKKLVFAPEALEQLGGSLEVVLDKTGTLTTGRLTVLDYSGAPELLSLAAAMERDARHPVGQAIVKYATTSASGASACGAVSEVLGKGLLAQVQERTVVVGSAAFVLEHGASQEQLDACGALPGAVSPIYVFDPRHGLGRFLVGDALREDAAAALRALRAAGHRLHLLSGDDPRTVDEVAALLSAQALGAEHSVGLFESVRGGVSPEQKLHYVGGLKQQRDEKRERRAVVMVGDGINDSGALALADVGVAVQGAAEASRLSAQVYLPQPGVAELYELIQGARRTLGTIRRGILFSLVYNAVGISSAALGVLGPLGAAVLMPLSSLTVVTNAYRSRSFDSLSSSETLAARRKETLS